MGILILMMLLSLALASVAGPGQEDARQKDLSAIFQALEKGIRAKDETSFKGPWLADAYGKNFVGGSGLAGKEVFGQGTRKNWLLKPDLSRLVALGEGAVVIVPCEVWAWEKEKSVDKVEMLLVKDKDAWKILGGGEKRVQVEALANRWLKKEPLDAPEEKE